VFGLRLGFERVYKYHKGCDAQLGWLTYLVRVSVWMRVGVSVRVRVKVIVGVWVRVRVSVWVSVSV
jgi:hypothetical protein